jgi:murein DD-endopeptidase MepM/ murein hydrolase activator NlpD
VRAALSRAVPFVAVLAAAVPATAAAAPADESGERTVDRGDDVRAQQDLGMRPSDAPGGETPLPGAQPAGPGAQPARPADDGARAGAYPVDGPHRYGDGFGDRGGSHRGQDVMARCGTPLRAVRDATVRRVATEAAAGRYIVLHDGASGEDYVYMHLSAVDVASGDRVTDGEKVGAVGRTGDATACHLHVEEWTAPGWYDGGRAKDPVPLLRSLAAS